jgi:hypothetical protein
MLKTSPEAIAVLIADALGAIGASLAEYYLHRENSFVVFYLEWVIQIM